MSTWKFPTIEVNGKEVDLFKDDKPMYAPKPNGNKWPFDRKKEKQQVEQVKWPIEGPKKGSKKQYGN
jgi:hypothetical protein